MALWYGTIIFQTSILGFQPSIFQGVVQTSNFLLNRRAPSAQKVAGRFLNLENTKNHAKVRISLPSPSKCRRLPPERRTLAGRMSGVMKI